VKRFISVLALACFVAVFSLAQDSDVEKKAEKKEVMKSEGKWHGYVVDAMCAKGMMKKDNPMERAAKHTKECALEEGCAASGFGLFYDGKYYKFDEAGDKMAKAAIEKSTLEKGLMFDVTGNMKDEKIMVASLSEMKMDKMEMGKKMDSKKMEKKEEHKH
jgi:hypothetical protein